jgi:hypothetical protein
MPVINVTLQGRFGNTVMQWLFCRAVSERYGYDLNCEEWIGERVFDIAIPRYTGPTLLRLNETELLSQVKGELAPKSDIEFRGYAQMQESMVYTKRQAQSWLKIRPEHLAALDRLRQHHFPKDTIVAHHRKGDFISYSYPVVSRLSCRQQAHRYFGFGSRDITYVSEEFPLTATGLPDGLEFLPDFYRLMMAPTLMRANSTFSFVAGLLGNGLVLSPRIDGLVGGVEHDNVQFEAGNHCRLANLDFCSDLHVVP